MVMVKGVYKYNMLVFVVSYGLKNVFGFFDAREVNIVVERRKVTTGSMGRGYV